MVLLLACGVVIVNLFCNQYTVLMNVGTAKIVQVLVYNFADLRLLHAIETLDNPSGLLALSPSADAAVMACPGLHAGQVGERAVAAWKWVGGRGYPRPWSSRMLNACLYRPCTASVPQVRVELCDTRRTKFISAHTSPLAALALSSNGKLLATAGEKGTLVSGRGWGALQCSPQLWLPTCVVQPSQRLRLPQGCPRIISVCTSRWGGGAGPHLFHL